MARKGSSPEGVRGSRAAPYKLRVAAHFEFAYCSVIPKRPRFYQRAEGSPSEATPVLVEILRSAGTAAALRMTPLAMDEAAIGNSD
jgi:hypothetical protein